MIVSHRRKCVFMRVPKTGSTTLSKVIKGLGIFDPKYDLVSGMPLGDARQLRPQINMRNYLGIAPVEFQHGHRRCFGAEKDRDGNPTYISSHMTLEMMVMAGILTEENVADYDVYGFIRNPCDRLLSAWRHVMRGKCSPEHIKEHILSGEIMPGGPIFDHPQSDWFMLNGHQAALPYLFEEYENEMTCILNNLGLTEEERQASQRIPIENRKNWYGMSVANMLDDETCNAINERYPKCFLMWHASKQRATENSKGNLE